MSVKMKKLFGKLFTKANFIILICIISFICGLSILINSLPIGLSLRESLYIAKARYNHSKINSKSAFPLMQLNVPKSSMQRLEKDRKRALEKSILTKDEKNYVSAKINFKGVDYDVKIRLKGMQPDHWKSHIFWSFKVKVKNGDINGMKSFGLMFPTRRGCDLEWVYHKLVDYCSLPSLKYEFIDLKLNDMSLGPYAIEECFSSEMTALENNNIVIKFDYSKIRSLFIITN